MIDQTRGGEAPIATASYEIHGRPAPARRVTKPARPSRLLVAGGATLGLLAVAGVSWAALSFLAAEPGKPRRGAMVTGSVDYPDLKDGVPAIVAPRGQVRVVGMPSSASTAQEVAATTASPVDSSTMANLAAGGTLPRPTISPSATARAAPVAATTAQAAAPRTETPRIAAIAVSPVASVAPSAPAATVSLSGPVVASPPAPLPTPRPAGVTSTRTAPRPSDAARPADQPRIVLPAGAAAATSPPQRVATTRPPARVEPSPEAPATEDDHINVFGLAVPTIGATSRRIREGVEALGDAVGRL